MGFPAFRGDRRGATGAAQGILPVLIRIPQSDDPLHVLFRPLERLAVFGADCVRAMPVAAIQKAVHEFHSLPQVLGSFLFLS
jgi:hypothetical protein